MTDNVSASAVHQVSKSEITVRVTFPITRHGPFTEEVEPATTVQDVLTAAKNHFDVHDDSQFTYVLAHDGTEESNTVTVGSIADEAKAVVFTLVKKITLG
jgi:hypothetical protein